MSLTLKHRLAEPCTKPCISAKLSFACSTLTTLPRSGELWGALGKAVGWVGDIEKRDGRC